MQAISKARRFHSVLRSSMHLSTYRPLCAGDYEIVESSINYLQQCRNHRSASAFQLLKLSGLVHKTGPSGFCGSMMSSVQYSSEANTDGPTDTVKVLYDKIIESVCSKRTMAPNDWTWSMIRNCKNRKDIKLLFDALQNLRMFRLSNLRIHENFNCHLCQEVAKACVRVGALDFGKKTLCKHNVYGLTPSVTSAHHLLLHAKKHKDTKLMVDVMNHLKWNGLPLQPGTADIVFSICYDVDKWELLCKYAKSFINAGVKFRRTTFDTWMEFAAKIGNVDSIWEIEKLRSECMKQHTLISAISCAKGFLLEGKPEEASAVVNALNKILTDEKKSSIAVEVEKLVSEWPFEVIKRQKPKNRKALSAGLQSALPVMVNSLSCSGLTVSVRVRDFPNAEDNNQ